MGQRPYDHSALRPGEVFYPPNFWEILVTLAYVSAETANIRLGTGVLITPMRLDIVVTAKQVATLDVLSKGRVMLGVGVGAYREEFEALNPGLQAHRGELVEESIQALRMLFSQRQASFQGAYYKFADVEMYPKPMQNPIPFYIGGNSHNAITRTARYGDGWLPAGLPPEKVAKSTTMLRRLTEEEGRAYEKIDVAIQYICFIGETRKQARERFRNSQMYQHVMSLTKSTFKDQDLSNPEDLNLIGTVSSVVDQVKELEEAGLKHLCGIYFVADTVTELLDQMQTFAEEVLPHIYEPSVQPMTRASK